MTSYFVMSSEDASRYLQSLLSDDPMPLGDVQRRAGEGQLIDLRVVDGLRDQLVDLRSHASRNPNGMTKGGQFEQQACEIVHKMLSSLPKEALANADFWTWLAVAKFSDLIEWRFGAGEGLAKLENYGVGSWGRRTENMMFRLWLRGEIAIDKDASDPYELARTGDQDLWRSHILRQRYASARPIARALLRLQAGKLRHRKLTVAEIRELAKRLRRLRANVFLEALPANEANQLVLELAIDL